MGQENEFAPVGFRIQRKMTWRLMSSRSGRPHKRGSSGRLGVNQNNIDDVQLMQGIDVYCRTTRRHERECAITRRSSEALRPSIRAQSAQYLVWQVPLGRVACGAPIPLYPRAHLAP
jgi:hypothetical protein